VLVARAAAVTAAVALAGLFALPPGASEPSPELRSAVSYALSRNVVIIDVALGSADKQNWRYGYPSGIPGVIGVSTLMLPGRPGAVLSVCRRGQQLRPGRRTG
jgi:hypothetical protein